MSWLTLAHSHDQEVLISIIQDRLGDSEGSVGPPPLVHVGHVRELHLPLSDRWVS